MMWVGSTQLWSRFSDLTKCQQQQLFNPTIYSKASARDTVLTALFPTCCGPVAAVSVFSTSLKCFGLEQLQNWRSGVAIRYVISIIVKMTF